MMTIDELKSKLNKELSENMWNKMDFFMIFHGSKSANFFYKLKGIRNLLVLFSEWNCRNIFSYLLYPIASGHGGIIKILSKNCLMNNFAHLTTLCYCEIYVIPHNEYKINVRRSLTFFGEEIDKFSIEINSEALKSAKIFTIDTDYPHSPNNIHFSQIKKNSNDT